MSVDSPNILDGNSYTSLNEMAGLLRVISNISIKGAATVYIIYQITDINVNIYDISLYLEWYFKEKEKNQKKKNIYKVNKYYKCIMYYIYNIYIY